MTLHSNHHRRYSPACDAINAMHAASSVSSLGIVAHDGGIDGPPSSPETKNVPTGL